MYCIPTIAVLLGYYWSAIERPLLRYQHEVIILIALVKQGVGVRGIQVIQ